MVIQSIAKARSLDALRTRLSTARGVVHAAGLWGSSAPMLAAWCAPLPRLCLYLTAHFEDADTAQDDLDLLTTAPATLFPAWETLPGEGAAAGEVEAERLRLCAALQRKDEPGSGNDLAFIIAPIQALMQPVPEPAQLAKLSLTLEVGRPLPDAMDPGPDGLLAWALDHQYERLDMVESPGDVARRGDLVDIFPPGEADPLRIEFLEDEIESIRPFDLSTQRSRSRLQSASIIVRAEEIRGGLLAQTSLLDYLPGDTLIVLDGPAEVQEMGRTFRQRLGGPDSLFVVDDLLSTISRFPQLHLERFGGAATTGEDVFPFDVRSLARFEGKASDAVAELVRYAADHEVHVVCDAEGERQRLREMLEEADASVVERINLHTGVLHRGFEWAETSTIVVGHHEVFRRHRPVRRLRRTYASRPLESWAEISPGDLVVHVTHGIARYRGLEKLKKGSSDQVEEYLALEFDQGGVIHVPTSQIDLVQKYIGAGGIKPKLSRLGGKRWQRTKEQVESAVTDLASELLATQAKREAAEGVAYPPDTVWQREFEAAFPYEETEDQLRVAAEVREDLCRPRPADRLICGDVGYGKTELAMRAAFKVMEYGRQVAVLVPTTVLAEQHYASFLDRMTGYPFTMGCLSRFRSQSEQQRIIRELKRGQLDLVIGTHRLLSKDVGFANLGLVVIDEEQRFGVEHKERLKQLRASVDMLTLSATPIPRTLHMALTGLRDISRLQTPPVDRRSIATQVRPFSARLIREAVIREMNRDGQVYIVHNFVHSIHAFADRIRQIVPEAKLLVGHGQMKSGELEKVMQRFLRRDADALVATTIIESGLDIPTANTILINRAERFGLADLHQLRGRVGRSSHRAYCYLLLSPDHPPTSKASRRLKAIEEFSELGAGFRIATRDLEIRGAGNLLGKEQSGDIAAVGYELYCRLLEGAVRRLRQEPEPTPTAVQLDLDVAAHLPRQYVTADRSRVEIYRRVTGCSTVPDLNQLEQDLADAFGPVPRPVERLLELAEIRVQAREFGIRSIVRRPPDVVFRVESLVSADRLFEGAPGSVRMPDPETLHWRLEANYLEPDTLLAVLRNLMRRARERVESTT
jgi:transcription-repair coupling factor (superfamily II helicase)